MARYHQLVEKKLTSFYNVKINQVFKEDNLQADALSIMAIEDNPNLNGVQLEFMNAPNLGKRNTVMVIE